MNSIFIRDFDINVVIGVYEREREAAQPVRVDLEIALPGSRNFDSDRLQDTIDYAAVVARIRETTAGTRFNLLEALGERIARLLLDEFRAPWLRLTLSKRHILPNVGAVGVTLERGARP